MSRIEEALARARNSGSEVHRSPDVGPPSADLDTNFPIETQPSAIDTAVATEEPPARSIPPQTARGVETPFVHGAESNIIEAEGDIKSLTSNEKLMFGLGDSTPVEQYRRLAARLLMAQTEQGVRVVMITSALPGEGKTLTATNLALTLSESYKRDVLLVDADLRRPWLHQMFQLPNVTGLNDGLRAGTERKVPLIRFSEHLSILTAGRPDSDPMSVLSGERMRRVLEEAGTRFEWVIIDTPPVALLTDAHLLSSLVDAVLLVVQSGVTPLPAIRTAVQAVGNDKIMGVVLNRADTALADNAYHYYGRYDAHPTRG